MMNTLEMYTCSPFPQLGCYSRTPPFLLRTGKCVYFDSAKLGTRIELYYEKSRREFAFL